MEIDYEHIFNTTFTDTDWFNSTTAAPFNSSFYPVADDDDDDATVVVPSPPSRHLGVVGQVVITVSYIIGVIGNLAALTILCRGTKKLRNNKHSLMLKCLATNDLVALLGMLLLMNLQLYLPQHLVSSRWFCMLRVVWRLFGLGSGCVACVMAVERWLALTHPFLYQKRITYYVIRRAIFCLWAAVLVLVCLPFLGFGIYYRAETHTCVRYRTASQPKDVAYAYLFFAFGCLLAVCIVWCNLAVIRVLCHLGCHADRKRVGRRISRSSSKTSTRSRSLVGGNSKGEIAYNACTQEELAFARLMAVLCIFFIICWMPQMMTIPIAQFAPDSPSSRPLFRVADILMSMHFTLDPYIYVLLRCQRRPCFTAVLKVVCRACWPGEDGTPATSIALTDQERAAHTHSLESNKTGTTHHSPQQQAHITSELNNHHHHHHHHHPEITSGKMRTFPTSYV